MKSAMLVGLSVVQLLYCHFS